MVGETRDKETAMMAIEASLTGHFVLSTLHTNDASSAPTRLIDMGVQPFLISSSLVGVLAQRLVRTLCDNCKSPTKLSEYEMQMLDSRGQGGSSSNSFNNNSNQQSTPDISAAPMAATIEDDDIPF